MYKWWRNTGYAIVDCNHDLTKANLEKCKLSLEHGKIVLRDIDYKPIGNFCRQQTNGYISTHLSARHRDSVCCLYELDNKTRLIVHTYSANFTKNVDGLYITTEPNATDWGLATDFIKWFVFTVNSGDKCIYITKLDEDQMYILGKKKYAKIKILNQRVLVITDIQEFAQIRDVVLDDITNVYQYCVKSNNNIHIIDYKDVFSVRCDSIGATVDSIFKIWQRYTDFNHSIFQNKKDSIGKIPYAYDPSNNSVSFRLANNILDAYGDFLSTVVLGIDTVTGKIRLKLGEFQESPDVDGTTIFQYTGPKLYDIQLPRSGYIEIQNSTEQRRREEIIKEVLCTDMANNLKRLCDKDVVDTADTPIAMPITHGLTKEVARKVYGKSNPQDVDNWQTIDNIIQGAINSPDVCLIQGPAGTGKTTIINAIITRLQEIDKNTKFLICAEQHVAVNNIMERIATNSLSYIFSSKYDEQGNAFGSDSARNTILDKCQPFIASAISQFDSNPDTDIYDKSLQILEQEKYDELGAFIDTLPHNADNKLVPAMHDIAALLKMDNIDWIDITTTIYLSAYCTEDEVKQASDLKQFLKNKFFGLLRKLSPGRGQDMANIIHDFATMIQSKSVFADSMAEYADTIGGTCAQSYKVKQKYDYVIIDEAARANPLDIMLPISMGRRVILVGDHKQLPHFLNAENYDLYTEATQDDKATILRESLFGLLYDNCQQAYQDKRLEHNRGFLLDTQYRMPKTIGTYISNTFYDGKLKNGTHQTDLGIYDIYQGKNLVWLDIPSFYKNKNNREVRVGTSLCRMVEIEQLTAIVKNLINQAGGHAIDIGVMSFYKGQIDGIRQALTDIRQVCNQNPFTRDDIGDMCGTVDSFQGKEFDVVILSCVRSNPDLQNLGFLDSAEGKSRINVALSRAKKLLIVIGDCETLSKNECFAGLENHIKNNKTECAFIKLKG